jgi:hypothetical protein
MSRLTFGLDAAPAKAFRRNVSFPRSLAVTAGLVVGGTITGGAAGSILAVLVGFFTSGVLSIEGVIALAQFGAMIGAPAGAFVLPSAGWLFLRDIPFGQALGWMIGGAIGGGYFGWFLAPRPSALAGSVFGAAFGLVIAVLGARSFGRNPDSAVRRQEGQ